MRWFAYIIVVLFILTMIIIIWAYFIPDKINSPKARKRDLYKALGLSSPRKVNNFETNNISPPRPFGYKITWLAFKNPNRARLIREFKPEKNKAFNTNWELGIEGAYEGYCFISPPVNEWTFVVNPNLDFPQPATMLRLKDLSYKFGEVQYFGNHRVTNAAAWARIEEGKIIRAFCIADGDTLFNEGDLTKKELEIIENAKKNMNADDKAYYHKEGFEKIFGYEDYVMEMAEFWSINPQTLGTFEGSSEPGIIFKDF